MTHKVYILILNWNGWKDTLECLESVFKNQYTSYQVIVCDNNSCDGSMEKIKDWAEGRSLANSLKLNSNSDSRQEYSQKPIRYVELDRNAAERGGYPTDREKQLILIQTGGNLGFAGGNNVGLRYVLQRDDFDYVWLLNNDTVIEVNALEKLVRKVSGRDHIGMCGSTLLYYYEPDTVQAQGGAIYNKWLGLIKEIGGDLKRQEARLQIDKSCEMNYVIAASMLISKAFLLEIGLMNEEYFLYFEELDWATRAQCRYTLEYEPDSIVYHKVGRSIGSANKVSDKSMISDYFSIRNRLLFTANFYPLALPTVYLSLVGVMFNRLRKGQYPRIWMIIRIVLNFILRKNKGIDVGIVRFLRGEVKDDKYIIFDYNSK